MSTDPEQDLERGIEELEERVDALEGSIKDAKGQANVDVIAGDWQGAPDQAGAGGTGRGSRAAGRAPATRGAVRPPSALTRSATSRQKTTPRSSSPLLLS